MHHRLISARGIHGLAGSSSLQAPTCLPVCITLGRKRRCVTFISVFVAGGRNRCFNETKLMGWCPWWCVRGPGCGSDGRCNAHVSQSAWSCWGVVQRNSFGCWSVPQGYHGDSIYNNCMFTCGSAGFTIPSPGGSAELVQLGLCGGYEIRV